MVEGGGGQVRVVQGVLLLVVRWEGGRGRGGGGGGEVEIGRGGRARGERAMVEVLVVVVRGGPPVGVIVGEQGVGGVWIGQGGGRGLLEGRTEGVGVLCGRGKSRVVLVLVRGGVGTGGRGRCERVEG